jgi:hypothetical protein
MLCGALLAQSHINRWIASIAKREITQAALVGDLRDRNKLLHAVSITSKELLTAATIDTAMATVLETGREWIE